MSEEQYEPFDQAKWLGKNPVGNDPALIAWEKAHGHDVRLKCYVEFGCMVIEPTLERDLASLRTRLASAEARVEELVAPPSPPTTRSEINTVAHNDFEPSQED